MAISAKVTAGESRGRGTRSNTIDQARSVQEPGLLAKSGVSKIPPHMNDRIQRQFHDVGLVLVEAESMDDRFVTALALGLEERLIVDGVRLVTRVVSDRKVEFEVYRRWARAEAVDAVVLIGTTSRDARKALLVKVGLPYAAVTDSIGMGSSSTVVVDNAAMAEVVVEFLFGLHYERVIYIAGVGSLGPARFASGGPLHLDVLRTKLESEQVIALALESMAVGRSAIVFDDDMAAVAAMAALTAYGINVPGDIGVLAWTDSLLCQSSDPTITGLNWRANDVGAMLGECLLRSVTSSEPVVLTAPSAFIVRRAST